MIVVVLLLALFARCAKGSNEFVIQHLIFNLQSSLIFNCLQVRGGLDKVAGKSEAKELN